MGVWTPGPGPTTGDDTFVGDNTNEVASGGEGNDTLFGNGGSDTLWGGLSGDSLTGGADADVFIFGAGAGTDTITDFDADPTGGQDIIDITQFGITSGDFAARVTITDLGADTQVVIDGSVTIILTGVDGNGNNVITIDDFGLI